MRNVLAVAGAAGALLIPSSSGPSTIRLQHEITSLRHELRCEQRQRQLDTNATLAQLDGLKRVVAGYLPAGDALQLAGSTTPDRVISVRNCP